MTHAELVRTSFVDGVGTLTLHRPEARNALSLGLIRAMAEGLRELASQPGLRVLVLAGEGKVFCAGMDLKAVANDAVAMGDMLRELSRVTRTIRRMPVPIIARVQGAAVGGGCGLMVVCDFAVTHPEAKVGYPEVDLGVCPAVVAPWLIRRIGAGRARSMLLAGGTISGEEGFRSGLATHLAPLDELDATVASIAKHIATGCPKALAATKHWLNELDGSLDDAVLDKAAEISARIIAGEEAQTRLRALFSRG